MTTIAFDTHKFVKDLQSAGIPQEQAEAFVRAQQDILSQALDSTLATRGDLQMLEKALHTDMERLYHKLIEHDGEFKTIKWMLGIIVGGIVMLVLKAFFPA
jgi:hypothetical protein